jgi:vancomycin permeability regulator SanA
MLKKIFKFLWRFTLIFCSFALCAAFVLFFVKFVIQLYAAPRIFTVSTVTPERVAIVFGAGLRYDGTPTAVLRDRVQTAVQLYQQGKVKKLLMSGDNRFVDYNEPEAMRQYALELGVPDKDIVSDYAGRRTYDTCYRAKAIFQIDSAILVTQGFHLPRALFLCNSLGVKSTGVEANNIRFRKLSLFIWNTRELFAISQAAWDIHVSKPLPVLGKPEPIP